MKIFKCFLIGVVMFIGMSLTTSNTNAEICRNNAIVRDNIILQNRSGLLRSRQNLIRRNNVLLQRRQVLVPLRRRTVEFAEVPNVRFSRQRFQAQQFIDVLRNNRQNGVLRNLFLGVSNIVDTINGNRLNRRLIKVERF